MVIEKDKRLKRKVSVDKEGKVRRCRICGKPIDKEDIENDNFEYVKSKINENFFHSKCVEKEIEDARKRNRSKIKRQS